MQVDTPNQGSTHRFSTIHRARMPSHSEISFTFESSNAEVISLPLTVDACEFGPRNAHPIAAEGSIAIVRALPRAEQLLGRPGRA